MTGQNQMKRDRGTGKEKGDGEKHKAADSQKLTHVR